MEIEEGLNTDSGEKSDSLNDEEIFFIFKYKKSRNFIPKNKSTSDKLGNNIREKERDNNHKRRYAVDSQTLNSKEEKKLKSSRRDDKDAKIADPDNPFAALIELRKKL